MTKKIFQRSRDDKNDKSKRKCFRCGDPNHLIGECPKLPRDKNQRAFVRGSWSDSGKEDDEKAKVETCLMAQASSELATFIPTPSPKVPRKWIFEQKVRLLSRWRRLQKKILTSSGSCSDGVTTFKDSVTIANMKKPLEDSTG
ncbi:alpha/beta hydrolases superfamily protein [Tanacetum coccineum]